jgi:hypothetical protein
MLLNAVILYLFFNVKNQHSLDQTVKYYDIYFPIKKNNRLVLILI